MTSLGFSQLPTSHQSGPPALVAQAVPGGFQLDGFMPWVTSAVKCQYIVTGAVMPDGMHVLLAAPTDSPGIIVEPPLELMALQGSLTCLVRCNEAFVDER